MGGGGGSLKSYVNLRSPWTGPPSEDVVLMTDSRLFQTQSITRIKGNQNAT